MSKMDAAQLVDLATRYKNGESVGAIAEHFDIDRSTVRKIMIRLGLGATLRRDKRPVADADAIASARAALNE